MYFFSLQYVMVEIMKNGGCNNFKLPHVGKSIKERQGTLPQAKCVGGLCFISFEATYGTKWSFSI